MKIRLENFNYKGRHYDYVSIRIGKKDKVGQKMFRKIVNLIFKYDKYMFKED